LGIDVGTTRVKAVAFNLEGEPLASSIAEYGILTPKPAWAEQKPEVWWRTLREVVHRLFKDCDVHPGDVRGLGVSVLTPALVPVDEKGRALRNAILMIDQRAVEEAELIHRVAGKDKVFEITGNRIAPGTYTAPSILWIKRHEPEVYEKTYKFLHANGYIVHRMTGAFTTDYTQASATLLLDIKNVKWSEDLCETLNIDQSKLPEIRPSWKAVGELTEEAARELNLPRGIPVAAGANDTACACIGTGVVEEGMALESIGTTITLSYITAKPSFDIRVLNRLHAVPERYILMAATSTPGAAYRWLRDQFYRRKSGATYREMDEEAERAPPGSRGLIFLPYLSGERTPIWNPNARGVLFGLTLTHTRGDVARAFLEGGAYCVKDCLEVFKSRKFEVSEIRVTGGGAKSRLWRSIMADVLGLTLRVPNVEEASCLGAAVLGGTAAGVYGDPIEASRRIVKVVDEVKPRLGNHVKYQRYYKLFKRVYLKLVEEFDELKALEAS